MDLYKIMEEKLGSKIGEYRKKWEAAGKDGIVLDYPLHLNFELNFGCNLKCDFCLYSIPPEEWNYEVDISKKISLNKYSEIIDNSFDNNLYSVEFNGINEPLLKKDIVKYIKYACEKDIPVTSLHTNSIALDSKKAEDLISSGLKIIIFSVDAINKGVYKDIRSAEVYDLIFNNINNFLKIKKDMNSIFPLVQMSFNKNKCNYKEVDDYTKYWESRVDCVSVSHFCNPFIGGKKYKEIENKFRLDSNVLYECYEPYQRLFIRNNGKVSPCCSFFGGEFIVGDIYNQSIYDIWHGEKMKEIRLKVNCKNGFNLCDKCRESMVRDGI